LTLEIFIYFGGWWDVLFWVISILVFVYKGGV
jgi:transmembrane protein 216